MKNTRNQQYGPEKYRAWIITMGSDYWNKC